MKKNNFDLDEFIIISSSCKITKGKKRSLIVDYLRKELYFIPNDYYELLSNIDRKTIKYAFNYVNKDNHDDLVNFINYLIENEIIFLNKNLDLFPVISNELEENYYLRDAIIEIEDNQSSFEVFVKTINQLQDLGCNDLQIRFPLKISTNFILMILDEIDKKNINYVELHINFNENINEDFLLGLIEKYSVVSHIFVYGFSCDKIVTHKIKKKDYYPLLLGNIYYIKDTFDNANGCGKINKESLEFNSIYRYNELKKRNGCLFKKVTIDKCGNIKNCPLMSMSYGNIKNDQIKDIIKLPSFLFLGNIKKDDIDVCKECEFRYACSDCRAFIQNYNNIYSKPLKCGYNPDTCTWEEWSDNPLKNIGGLKIVK